jgi:NCAIR mutase (PurE)-related protein
VDEADLIELLEGVRSGRTAPDEAVARLRRLPFADLGHSRIDHHRALRQGMAEAVYGPGKTAAQCVENVRELLAGGGGPVLLTRASEEQAAAVLAALPRGRRRAGTVTWRPASARPDTAVAVVSAGTADCPVAEEALAVLGAHGVCAEHLADVGVAGLHRLLAVLDRLEDLDAVVVVAGMEGALASVLGGLVAAPVVAVPTSVGYGASLEGVTALLAMLSSCAAGVTVVGIDNGYGAACAVLRLLEVSTRRAARGG